MAPLFSVVIPTYNRATKVVHAVKSVLAQTFTDYELWVVDDGSTDNTLTVLEAFRERLNYLRKSNGGAASARNAGIACAQGDYIAFLDSDDSWYPNKLQRVAQAIRARPQVGLFYSQIDVVNEAGVKLWTYKSRQVGDNGYIELLAADFVAASSAVVKRACFAEVGVFDESLGGCEDWDMWIRIARLYPIQLVAEPLVVHERKLEGAYSSDYRRWIKAIDEVVDKAFAADLELDPMVQQDIPPVVAYTKAKICLSFGDEQAALIQFKRSLELNPGNWKAMLYFQLLSHPRLRRCLPHRVRMMLRLPEAFA